MKAMHSISMVVSDAEGNKDSIKGTIKSFTDDVVTIYHQDGGEATFPRVEIVGNPVVGKAKLAKPKVIKRPVEGDMKDKTPAAKPRQAPVRKKVAGEGPSRQEIVNGLYKKNHPRLNRKQMIELIVEEAGMTPKGASTYYSNAKKAAQGWK
jgi:hypothetical protein